MRKKIIFFDGDGTLWYPHATRRSRKPYWIYYEEETKDEYLKHLVLTPQAAETLARLREWGIRTVVLSTHPHESEEAARVLGEKVAHFELHDLFDEVYATAEYPAAKSEKAAEILTRLGLSKADALMVGDSYRWDYQLMVENGIEAVLVNSDYHQEKKAEEPVEVIIDDLDGILPLLGIPALL